MFSDLPRFNAARRYGVALLVLGGVLAFAGGALVFAALRGVLLPWIEQVTPRALGYLGAAFFLPAGGFVSAAMMSFARQRYLHLENAPDSPAKVRKPAPSKQRGGLDGLALEWIARAVRRAPDIAVLADWPQTLATFAFSGMTLATVGTLWSMPPAMPGDPVALKILAGTLVVAAFPLLVLERIFGTMSTELLPEASSLDRLLRVPLASFLGVAVAMVLVSGGVTWAAAADVAIAIVIAVVATELLLRAAATFFVPFADMTDRRMAADSSVSGALLRLSIPAIGGFNIAVRRQLGVDLSRSWALAFVQKAALPVVASITLFAWLVTGLTSLGVNQRGVYERFGRPVTVFQPGLHLHMPWPLGIVRPIEVGIIHQLPIEFLLPDGNGQTVEEAPEPTYAAEAVPPESADRLWDDAHPFEGSYLIASEENGQQSFQLVAVDMAVVYQAGLSDEAARDSAYRVTDADELIQAISGQILVRYLSHNTLLDLLGRSRETFAGEFQAALQKELDKFSTGLEVLAISIEAIHPPPAAASSYHNVQAAQIRSNTEVSISRGTSVRNQQSTTQQAADAVNRAKADGAELTGKARTTATQFGGDRAAYQRGGNAFLLERWFANLSAALQRTESVIIDHRLRGDDIPLLDLRSSAMDGAAIAATTRRFGTPSAGFSDDDQK